MRQIQLLPGSQKAVSSGHPWVYRTQVDIARSEWPHDQHDWAADDCLAEVRDSQGRYLGTGLFNSRSMIVVRLITRRHEPVDSDLICRRVADAVQFRRMFWQPDTDSYRIIFAEADRLPGVIADLFGSTLVVQILSLGMERWQDVILQALIEQVRPLHVLLHNDDPIRLKEGLPLYRRTILGTEQDKVIILEHGVRLQVDLAGGQKTGCFLDQKANHARVRQYVSGKSVLDCFCYQGGFAINAALAGASSVTAVDISADALTIGRHNAELNDLGGQINWIAANAFDYLRQSVAGRHTFDIIILDPPAFAKSHAARNAARRGYKEINLSAFRLLPPGGILATHSCSYHMTEPLFLETVLEAASDARRIVRLLDVRRQDYDHPVLAGYPESHYLKSIWLQVVE